MHMHVYVCVYVSMRVYVCMYVCMYAYVYAYVCVCEIPFPLSLVML